VKKYLIMGMTYEILDAPFERVWAILVLERKTVRPDC
jgi:hypothetical protein